MDNLKTSKLNIESLKKMKANLKKPIIIDHVFIDKIETSRFKQMFPAIYKKLFDK